MAEAEERDIYIEAFNGTSAVKVFEWIVILEEEAGVPMENLSGATATFAIRANYGTTVLVSASEGSGIVINSGAGTLTLTLLESDFGSVNMTPEEQEFVYDLDLIDSTNKAFRLYKGSVTIGGDV